MSNPHPRSYLEERTSRYRLLFGRVSTYTDLVEIADRWLSEHHLKRLYAEALEDQKEWGGKEAFKLLVPKIRQMYLLDVYQAKRDLDNEREKAKSMEKSLKREIEVRELELREMEERLRGTLEELRKARRS